jgi:hypothetical protein
MSFIDEAVYLKDDLEVFLKDARWRSIYSFELISKHRSLRIFRHLVESCNLKLGDLWRDVLNRNDWKGMKLCLDLYIEMPSERMLPSPQGFEYQYLLAKGFVRRFVRMFGDCTEQVMFLLETCGSRVDHYGKLIDSRQDGWYHHLVLVPSVKFRQIWSLTYDECRLISLHDNCDHDSFLYMREDDAPAYPAWLVRYRFLLPWIERIIVDHLYEELDPLIMAALSKGDLDVLKCLKKHQVRFSPVLSNEVRNFL